MLVLVHWFFASLAFRNQWLGYLIKGRRSVLVRDGRPDLENLRRAEISELDLAEELRLRAQVEEPSEVRVAYMERSGQVSALPRRGLRAVTIDVAEGVQTIRLVLD